MRHYRKRIVAICLASALTVLGSFGVEGYQNSLVDLRINSGTNGFVNLTAYTKKQFSGSIKTEKIDNETYYIVLPDTISEMGNMPDIRSYNNIKSLQVVTYPYTYEQSGYTRIILKTYGNPAISTSTSVYLPNNNQYNPPRQETNYNSFQAEHQIPVNPQQAPIKTESYWDKYNTSTNNTMTSSNNQKEQAKATLPKPQIESQSTTQVGVSSERTNVDYNDVSSSVSKERLAFVIGVLLVIFLGIFVYIMSKDKMASIVGEQNDFELNDDDEGLQKHKSKTKKIRGAINKLDKEFSNNTGKTKEAVPSNIDAAPDTVFKDEEKEPAVIVDLDSLYKEKTKEPQENNTEYNNEETDDLAVFLNGFSYEEEQPQEESFNEEYYQETINNQNLKFSKADKEKLSKLIQNEISEEAISNITEYASDANTKKAPEKIQVLENILAEYTIKQNLSFSKDDVDAIKKIMDVELDSDFSSDLNTSRKRTEEMQKELEEAPKKPHQTSDIITLNVKDLLPDLSVEMKKQGNKRIESEAKPETIYYSEGYEVSKLSVDSELTDISKALKSKDRNEFRPSDDLPIVETGYEVETLSIKDELPNLADLKINPLQREDKKTKQKVDEKALLQSIANVQFKPFYEGVQEELNQFDGFEIVNDDIITPKVSIADSSQQEQDKYLDLDLYDTKRKKPEQTQKVNDDAQKLMQVIEEQKAERITKKIERSKENIEQDEKNVHNSEIKKYEQDADSCEVDGKLYNILKTVNCENSVKCYLATDEKGYAVIGKSQSACKVLKYYDSLASENIQTRINEKKEDGSIQYLVRVSVHKFIINVNNGIMEFVMDLC